MLYYRTCLEDAQSANEGEANIKLLSRAPVDGAKVDANSEGQMLFEGVEESEGTPRNNLTKAENEQTYAEINVGNYSLSVCLNIFITIYLVSIFVSWQLDCPADVTYSTIQEASRGELF